MSEVKEKTFDFCKFKLRWMPGYQCYEPALPSSEKRYCIFHEPKEDKSIEEFNDGIKHKISKKDYNFSGYWFPAGSRDILAHSFEYRTFEKFVNFMECTFNGAAVFTGSTFEDDVWFVCCTFEKEALFNSVIFKGWADFGGVTRFRGYTSFRKSTFEDDVRFMGVTFEEGTYEKGANFEGTTFKKIADFRAVIFKCETYFEGVNFNGIPHFICLPIKTQIKTVFSKLPPFPLPVPQIPRRTQIKRKIRDVFFKLPPFLLPFPLPAPLNTKIRQIRAKMTDIFFKLPPPRLIPEAIFYKIPSLNAKFEKPHNADIPFRKTKIIWHQKGEYHVEGEYHYQEMDYIRKQQSWFIRYIWANLFHRLLHGYGEKPHRVILCSVGIIIGCALLFMNFGIGETRLVTGSLPTYNIFKMLFEFYDISLTDLVNIGRYFYFSVVTFTTLGYGDFRPTHPLSHLISCIEAFVGMFMMALFVLVFARKWRR